jgi:hypothetical protein
MCSLMAVAAATFALACSDVDPNERPNVARPTQDVEVQLEVSNMAPAPGTEFVLLTRVRLGSDVRRIASFTARIAYDSTRLQLLGEELLGDAAMRIVNPAAGESRVAGFASDGFAEGALFALRFKASQPNAISTLQVVFDELHGMDGSDLHERVRVAATTVPRTGR